MQESIERLLKISDETLDLEIIIVDDCSSDGSRAIAQSLERSHPEIKLLSHGQNRGKGAALRTGIDVAGGELVAIQDADLEYDPQDLKRLLEPLTSGLADVVIGSRFISPGAHRVLYFWHSVANKFLTLLSNMFTDLNLTDMECCYKIFRSDVIKNIDLEENRFGIEPEIIAKVARQRARVYEMAVSYHGRTYEEGKKIGWKDGFRALYCILHYNLPYSPALLQFFFYLFVGGTAAVANILIFLTIYYFTEDVFISAPIAFISAALLNYYLCVFFIFRHRSRWSSPIELLVYFLVVISVGVVDLWITKVMIAVDISVVLSKASATGAALILNFTGRRFIVFPISQKQ